MNLEKTISLVIMGMFIITAAASLSATGDTITREEAIHISRNSELVKEGLSITDSFTIEAYFHNSSMVDLLKKKNDELYRDVPDQHDAWEVIWWFKYERQPGGYNVIVIVDAETGMIVYNGKGLSIR